MEILRHKQRIRVKDLAYNSTLIFISLFMAFLLLFVLLSPITYAYETPHIDDSGSSYNPIIVPFEPATGDSGQHTITSDGWFLGSSTGTTVLTGATVTAKVTMQDHATGKYKLLVKRDIPLFDEVVAESAEFDYTVGSITKTVTFTPNYATGENSTKGYFLVVQKKGLFWSDDIVMANSYPPRLTVLPLTDQQLAKIKADLGITGISDAKLKTVLSSEIAPALPSAYLEIISKWGQSAGEVFRNARTSPPVPLSVNGEGVARHRRAGVRSRL